jgi:8-oxo-dGTP pyrophosphatase MutT (NUDIX family)
VSPARKPESGEALGSTLRDAAVLVPVYRDSHGALRVVIVRRSDRGIHGGQLAFPGGNREPHDPTLLATALREAHEEIGLAPTAVTVLTELESVETRTTGYRVAPFLGRIERPSRWMPDPAEVAEIFEIAVQGLLAPGVHDETELRLPDWPHPRRIAFYHVGPHRLWGVSYRILHPLLPRLVAGEWPIA